MRAKLRKRIIAFALCMVMVLSSGTGALADDVKTDPEITNHIEETQNSQEIQSETVDALSETDTVEIEPKVEAPKAEEPKEVVQPTTEKIHEEETTVKDEEMTPEEAEILSEEVELKQEIRNEANEVICTVIAKLPAGAFKAKTSEVSMKVENTDASVKDRIIELAKQTLNEKAQLKDFILYNITFEVNGEERQPAKKIEVSYEGSNLHIEDTAKAKVFYYQPINVEEGQTKDELLHITEKGKKIEELEQAGTDTENLDEYDLSEIILNGNHKADSIKIDVRKSGTYGCYIEEDKVIEKKPITEETKQPLVLKYEDKDVAVEVSAKENGIIPANTKLQVIPILSDGKDTETQYKEVEEQLDKKAENEEYDIAGFLAYDISFVNDKGEEVEPKGDVKVTLAYKKETIPEGVTALEENELDITVMHLEEDSKKVVKQVVDMVADTEQKATIETTDTSKVKKAEFVTDSFSAFTVTWTVKQAEVDKLTTVDTVDHSTLGITMRMIDLEGKDGRMIGLANDKLIDIGGGYGQGNIKQGLLNPILNEQGYPVTSDKGYDKGETLKPLFSGGKTVNNLFRQDIYDETGYYEYSSFENYAYLGSDSNFKVYNQIGTPNNDKNYFYQRGNFMPYNDIKDGKFSSNFNLFDENGKSLKTGDPGYNKKLYKTQGDNNYQFGMYMDTNFVQPKGGIVSKSKEAMRYEFNGDDDLWIYIDDILVLDIGGVHDAHSGYIDFSTGEIGTYDSEMGHEPKLFTTTIKEQFQKAGYFPDGTKWNDEKVAKYFDDDTFIDYSPHYLKMFYMERGSGASNLHMKFNLEAVPEGQIEVKKELTNTDKEKFANVEFAFQVWAQEIVGTDAQGNETYSDKYVTLNQAVEKDSQKPVEFKSATFKPGGKDTTYENVFYLKPQQSVQFKGLKANRKYYVSEVGVSAKEFDKIIINGTEYVTYDEDEQISGVITDIETDKQEVSKRPVVVCQNNCSAYNSRELRVTKAITAGQSTRDTFSFQIQFTGQDGAFENYSSGEYYLKDKQGLYYYYNKDGKLVSQSESIVCGTTGKDGIVRGIPVDYTIVITQIVSGTSFLVKEVELDKEQYLEPDKSVNKEMCGDSKVPGADGMILLGKDAEVTITNTKRVNTLRIKKVDEQDSIKVLEGAVFEIQKWDGSQFESVKKDGKNWVLTTDEEGFVVFSELVSGKYKLVELEAPSGYLLDTENNSFEVDLPYTKINPEDSSIEVDKESQLEGGKYHTITKTVTNQKKTWEIIKRSSSSDTFYLADAEFELTPQEVSGKTYYGKSATETGKVVWYADKNHKNVLQEVQIEAGIYIFKETKAPVGYTASEEEWSIKIGQYGSFVSIDGIEGENLQDKETSITCYFENTPVYDLPSTGGAGIYWYMIGGMLLMFAAALILYKRRCKELQGN